MADLKYRPVAHDHKAFLKKANKRDGFKKAYDELEEEYALAKEMLAARARVGLSQEAVAEIMGTTKSAISRLEAVGKHAPSLTTLKKYAQAVGCHLEIKFVPEHAQPE
ncbi:Antitoxin HigA [Citrifermentans bremense]|uniref:Antitoxin HigA n=1 Tax=Citrifermentans bremense TaxID=60035 RepID=A0A6S6M0H5_9BACT|nr:helix-turn-helix transcriptional regulator [Citrifermentans bremense]BCG47088.1 Antitoxin HigA [Citrifermentans bremense]